MLPSIVGNNSELRQALVQTLNQNAQALGLTPEQITQLQSQYNAIAQHSNPFVPPTLAQPGQTIPQLSINPLLAQQLQMAAQAPPGIFPSHLQLQQQAQQQAHVQSSQAQQIRQQQQLYMHQNGHPGHAHAAMINQQMPQPQQAIGQRNHQPPQPTSQHRGHSHQQPPHNLPSSHTQLQNPQHHQTSKSHGQSQQYQSQQQQQPQQPKSDTPQNATVTFTSARGTTTYNLPAHFRMNYFCAPNPHIAQWILHNTLQQFTMANSTMCHRIEVPGVEGGLVYYHPAALGAILSTVLDELEALHRALALVNNTPINPELIATHMPEIKKQAAAFHKRSQEFARQNEEQQQNDKTPPMRLNGDEQIHKKEEGSNDDDDERPLVIVTPEHTAVTPNQMDVIRDLSKGTVSTAKIQQTRTTKRAATEHSDDEMEEIGKRVCEGLEQQISLLEKRIEEDSSLRTPITIPTHYSEIGSSSRHSGRASVQPETRYSSEGPSKGGANTPINAASILALRNHVASKVAAASGNPPIVDSLSYSSHGFDTSGSKYKEEKNGGGRNEKLSKRQKSIEKCSTAVISSNSADAISKVVDHATCGVSTMVDPSVLNDRNQADMTATEVLLKMLPNTIHSPLHCEKISKLVFTIS